ncbi:MAG: hypothetical protein ACXW2U_08915 [Telluria sp.]
MNTNKQEGAKQQAGAAAEAPGTPVAAAKVKVKDVIASDEHAGKGGSYIFNPETGKRELSEESRAGLAEAEAAEKKRAEKQAAALAAAELEND